MSRSAVTPQLVCDDHAGDVSQSFQEFAKELLYCFACHIEFSGGTGGVLRILSTNWPPEILNR